MRDLFSFNLRAMNWWLATMESGVATWVTLAHRLPELAAGTMSEAERNRMISEKVAASSMGAIKASQAAAVLGLKAAKRPQAAIALASRALAVADAAARPARRKVKANARRLSRKKNRRLK